MKHWESLIASRMRPCVTICKIEDAGKRNQRMCEKRWRKNNPEKVKEIQKRSDKKRKNDPKRKAWQKEYDASPERKQYHQKYREENKDEINARHREYNATEKEAEAAANRALVNAGLTPQERAEWEYKTKVGVAEALAKSSHPLVPEIMMAGDSKGGAGNAMDAVGLNMLMDLTDKLSKK